MIPASIIGQLYIVLFTLLAIGGFLIGLTTDIPQLDRIKGYAIDIFFIQLEPKNSPAPEASPAAESLPETVIGATAAAAVAVSMPTPTPSLRQPVRPNVNPVLVLPSNTTPLFAKSTPDR